MNRITERWDAIPRLPRDMAVPHAVTCFVADIDRFAFYNSDYGLLEGNRLLADLYEQLLVAFPTGQCFRIGDDQFAVILPGSAETPDGLFAGLAATARQYVDLDGRATVSFGCSSKGDNDQLRTLALNAVEDMYSRRRTAPLNSAK